jgi:hypothetical protein
MRQQRAHMAVLSHAMLEEQPAPGGQVARGFPGDLPDGIEAVGTRDQRAARLESEVPEVRVSLGDIGWVGEDEVEALARQRLEPASVPEFDLQAVLDRIALRDDERRGARLDRCRLIASAIAPLPVPRSTTEENARCRARSTSSSVSGLGMRTAGLTASSSP